MQVFYSEFGQVYDSYSFGYTNYAVREANDALNEIYNSGYLPYSGAAGIKDVFYMARSVRVALKNWEPNSENRRILSRFENLVRTEHIASGFDYQNQTFLSFCGEYFAKRHGPNVMPQPRLLHLFESGLITHVVEYKKDNTLLGYILEINDTTIHHYIFSFYDLAYVNQSLGLWMMIQETIEAQKQNREYMYLGTAYGQKGLYKTNFNNLEYWNGHSWVADREVLRTRCKTDPDRTLALIDEWKSTFTDAFFTKIEK